MWKIMTLVVLALFLAGPLRADNPIKEGGKEVGEGFKITRIELETEAQVPGIDETTFQELARKAKEGCPVSQALAGTEVVLQAHLKP